MSSSKPGKSSPPRRFDAHHRFFVACFFALASFLVLRHHASLDARVVAAWNAFALSTVVLAWLILSTQDPYEVRRTARLQDGSRTFLFVVVISAATVSLFAVFILLGSSKNLPAGSLAVHVGLSFAAVVLSWMLVHTTFALRYAHFYYRDAHRLDRDKIKGGLVFPSEANPDYLDFAYFSFVIGMTCQVSDVQISSRPMRRLAMVHGLISFAFNTAILAIFVNIVASLI
jgi:uncharacterized membrane protein